MPTRSPKNSAISASSVWSFRNIQRRGSLPRLFAPTACIFPFWFIGHSLASHCCILQRVAHAKRERTFSWDKWLGCGGGFRPTLGRYTQPDPISREQPSAGLRGASLDFLTSTDAALATFQDGPSLYGYARSAPVTTIDPKGLFSGPIGPSPAGDLCNLTQIGGKSPVVSCVNCNAPSGGVYSPYCPDCYVKSLDPKGGVAPIPKIIDPRQYQK